MIKNVDLISAITKERETKFSWWELTCVEIMNISIRLFQQSAESSKVKWIFFLLYQFKSHENWVLSFFIRGKDKFAISQKNFIDVIKLLTPKNILI